MTRSKIRTSGAEGLTLSSTDITIASGDLLFGTSAKGVNLGVTSNTDANTMDDYEEGTWTPGIHYQGGQNATMTQTSGVYTKVGRLVHCTCMIYINSKNSGTGQVYLSGLPFTVADSVANTSIEGNGVGAYYYALSSAVNTLTVAPISGGTLAEIYTGENGTNVTVATVSHFDDSAQARFSFNYAV